MRAVVSVAVLAAACGGEPDPVRIIGRCELVTDATRVIDPGERPAWPSRPAPGMVDGNVMLEWWELTPPDGPINYFAVWLDGGLEPDGDPLFLGASDRAQRSMWSAHDGALWGQVWSDPSGSDPTTPTEDKVYLWRLSPPPVRSTESTRVAVRVTRAGCDDCDPIGISNSSFSTGAQGLLPMVAAHGRVWGAFTAPWIDCGMNYGNFDRLHVFESAEAPEAHAIVWGGCDLFEWELMVANPYLFTTEEGLFAIFRLGEGDDGGGELNFLRLDETGARSGLPGAAGGALGFSSDFGAQPRAVGVPSAIIFAGRNDPGYARCFELRTARPDGTHARRAPWQLPCWGTPERGASAIWIGFLELLPVPRGAVAIWSERGSPALPGRVTPDGRYSERIRAVLLTPEGQRGSEIVDVTDAGATALLSEPAEELGPYPQDFVLGAVSEGAEVFVAWEDTRPEAPGIYGRRIRCTVEEGGVR